MTRTEVEAAVRTSLQDLTGRNTSNIPEDQDLGDAIGLDSLGRLELLADVEDRFDLFFLDADTQSAATIKEMVETVMHELEQAKEVA